MRRVVGTVRSLADRPLQSDPRAGVAASCIATSPHGLIIILPNRFLHSSNPSAPTGMFLGAPPEMFLGPVDCGAAVIFPLASWVSQWPVPFSHPRAPPPLFLFHRSELWSGRTDDTTPRDPKHAQTSVFNLILQQSAP